MIDDIMQVLIERADGEEYPEAQQYNEYLIHSMETIKGYINNIEHKLRKKMRGIQMESEFMMTCKKLNIEPKIITTYVTPEVKKELEKIADEDDTTIEQFLRDRVDDYIECRGQ